MFEEKDEVNHSPDVQWEKSIKSLSGTFVTKRVAMVAVVGNNGGLQFSTDEL